MCCLRETLRPVMEAVALRFTLIAERLDPVFPEAPSRSGALPALEALGGKEIQEVTASLGKTYGANLSHHAIHREALER